VSGVDPLVVSVKEAYTHLHSCIREIDAVSTTLEHKIIEDNKEFVQKLNYLIREKKLLKNYWEYITYGCPINPIIFGLIFPRKEVVDVQNEIYRLLEASTIDTYRIFKFLFNAKISPADKLMLLLQLFKEKSFQILTEDKTKALCSVLAFLLDIPEHKQSLRVYLGKDFKNLTRGIRENISVFLLELLEDAHRPALKDLHSMLELEFSGVRLRILDCYPLNKEMFQMSLLLDLKERSLEMLKYFIKRAVRTSGIECSDFLSNSLLSKLYERENLEHALILCKFFRKINDIFAEYKLVNFSNHAWSLLVRHLLREEVIRIPYSTLPSSKGSMLGYRNSLYEDETKLVACVRTLPACVLRNVFTLSLIHHKARNLSILWPFLGFDEAAILRMYHSCISRKYYYGAIYLSKSLPEQINLRIVALHLLLEGVSLDNKSLEGTKRVNLDKDVVVPFEIYNIFNSSDGAYLLRNIEHYLSLVKYVFNCPGFKEKLRASPLEFLPLSKCVGKEEVFGCIDFFTQLISGVTYCAEEEGKRQQALIEVLTAMHCFILRREYASMPSVLFEVIKSDCSRLEKLKALTWICSHLPIEEKEEVVNRTDSQDKTVLSYFDEVNIDTSEEWKQLFSNILTEMQGGVTTFLKNGSPELISRALKAHSPLASLLDSDQMLKLIRFCMLSGDLQLLKDLLQGNNFDSQFINACIFLCLDELELNSYIKYFLRKSLNTPFFCFDLALVSQLKSYPVNLICKFLRYAFLLHDFSAQKMLLEIGEKKKQKQFYEELRSYFGIKHPDKKVPGLEMYWGDIFLSLRIVQGVEFIQKAIKTFPRCLLQILLLCACLKRDRELSTLLLDRLNFAEDALINLLEFISVESPKHFLEQRNQQQPPQLKQNLAVDVIGFEMHIIARLASGIQATFLLQAMNEWLKNEFLKGIAQKQFSVFLKGSMANVFFRNPKLYPQLWNELAYVSGLDQIFGKEDLFVDALFENALSEGEADLLRIVFGSVSENKLKLVLNNIPFTENSLGWFSKEIAKNTERTLLLILEAYNSLKLLDDGILRRLFVCESFSKYKELRLKLFLLCSEPLKKEIVINIYGGNQFILFDVVLNNDNEFAEAILPYINEDNVGGLAVRLTPPSTIFEHITHKNRSIFKKITPIFPWETLRWLTASCESPTFCYLASIDKRYVSLAPVSKKEDILYFCVYLNISEALDNFVQGWGITEDQIKALLPVALEMEDNPGILRSLLLCSFSHHNIKVEVPLVNKLLHLRREKEVLDWMRLKLQGERALAYFQFFRKRNDLSKMLFDAANDNILQYVRSLPLNRQEKRELLPFLGVRAIMQESASLPKGIKATARGKLIYFQGREFSLKEGLEHVYSNTVLPLRKLQLEEASAMNTLRVEEKFEELEDFITKITFVDIVAANFLVKQRLMQFLPYLPLSKMAILIPHLDSVHFNYCLQGMSLNQQADYLYFASVEQKEDFILKYGLRHRFIDAWNAAKGNLSIKLINRQVKELEAAFKPHLPLLASEMLLDSGLIKLKKALKNEETSGFIKTYFKCFKNEVRTALKEAKQMRDAISQLSIRMPDEYIDFITGEPMSDPVIVTDILKNIFIVNRSTIPLLSGKNPNGGTSFDKECFVPDVKLKNKIDTWKANHPDYNY
jgi:hypothetical protein